jgi:hypothetical protein
MVIRLVGCGTAVDFGAANIVGAAVTLEVGNFAPVPRLRRRLFGLIPVVGFAVIPETVTSGSTASCRIVRVSPGI